MWIKLGKNVSIRFANPFKVSRRERKEYPNAARNYLWSIGSRNGIIFFHFLYGSFGGWIKK